MGGDHMASYAVQPGRQGPPAVVVRVDALQGADEHSGGEILGCRLVENSGLRVAEDSSVMRSVYFGPGLRRARLGPTDELRFVRFWLRLLLRGGVVLAALGASGG